MTSTTTAVILAAGMGTRMKSRRPKALQRLAHRPMIEHIITTAEQLFDHIVVVIGPDMDDLAHIVAPHKTVVQQERLGTGHAALTAMPLVEEGEVAILYADNPLITAHTMARLVQTYRQGAHLSLLGMRPHNPAQYGRLVTTKEGRVQKIVEYKDATAQERAIPLCNAGMMCADARQLQGWLQQIAPNNTQGEYYLTDVVALAAKNGEVTYVEASEDELIGVNSRAELAEAERQLQQRLRLQVMEAGVTLIDPPSVFLSADTVVGEDITIEPHVFIGPHVVLKSGCTIRAFSHLEGCTVEKNAVIGPYARLRPGTVCEEESRVGNFVELKNTHLGKQSKVNHLSYIGDADVGEGANIGAGSITCNYDGFFKHKTHIGPHSFIGSNSIMVAPLSIGAYTVSAAGSVLTQDVPSDAMAFGRARQVNKTGRGRAHQNTLKAKKGQN